jgi:hypothetical protein
MQFKNEPKQQTHTAVQKISQTRFVPPHVMNSPIFPRDIPVIVTLIARLPLSPDAQARAGCTHEQNACSFANITSRRNRSLLFVKHLVDCTVSTCKLHMYHCRLGCNQSKLIASYWFLTSLILRPWRQRRHFPPKRRLTFNWVHGLKSQKIGLLKTNVRFICILI